MIMASRCTTRFFFRWKSQYFLGIYVIINDNNRLSRDSVFLSHLKPYGLISQTKRIEVFSKLLPGKSNATFGIHFSEFVFQ
jgi:hypothetical protein